ncbi:MAG: HEPN domain-containing protein [Candidatus Electrothrix communis]|nr:MAG: HEPN domain-containing protein [Candidatus Electrothrix communis]
MIRDFQNSINDSRQLRSLHHHCAEQLKLPGEYSDLLRMSVVYCMSAFDKLIHDLVIYGMVEIFTGRRQAPSKYLKEAISLGNHLELINCSVPPPEIIFEGIVRNKLSHQCFMDPKKLADALSLVWLENHKWQVISDTMGRNQQQVVKELRNIYQRRNAIVHETDKDPSTNQKMPILTIDSERIENFILELGETIYRLVR